VTVDRETLAALSASISALQDEPQRPVPEKVIEALAPLAKPGTALKIDLDASAAIGAPLVTVQRAPAAPDLFNGLTKRQTEVAALLVAGHSNKAIADRLHISVGTVKDHVHAILQHTGLPSRSAVVAAARR